MNSNTFFSETQPMSQSDAAAKNYNRETIYFI